MVNTHTSVNVEDVLLSTRWRLIHVTLFTLLNLKMASIKKIKNNTSNMWKKLQYTKKLNTFVAPFAQHFT